MRYDRMRAIVSRRLDASGTNAALVWEEVTGGTGPMDPGEVTEVTAPVRVALTDYTLQERAGSSSIQEADRKAIVSAGEVAPDTSKLLRIDGHDWQIDRVRIVKPPPTAKLAAVELSTDWGDPMHPDGNLKAEVGPFSRKWIQAGGPYVHRLSRPCDGVTASADIAQNQSQRPQAFDGQDQQGALKADEKAGKDK